MYVADFLSCLLWMAVWVVDFLGIWLSGNYHFSFVDVTEWLCLSHSLSKTVDDLMAQQTGDQGGCVSEWLSDLFKPWTTGKASVSISDRLLEGSSPGIADYQNSRTVDVRSGPVIWTSAIEHLIHCRLNESVAKITRFICLSRWVWLFEWLLDEFLSVCGYLSCYWFWAAESERDEHSAASTLTSSITISKTFITGKNISAGLSGFSSENRRLGH